MDTLLNLGGGKARRRSRTAVLLALVVMTAAAATTPRELVKNTAQALVEALRAHRAELAGDPALAHRLADQTVVPHIDFPRIARWVAGRYWRSATAHQRRQFTEVFRQFLINTYVSAMVNYADRILAHADSVSFPPVAGEAHPGEATVRMAIRLEQGRQVAVDYRLHRRDGQWLIEDVSIDGISLVLTYRQSLSSQFARQGMDGVIRSLREHNAGQGGKSGGRPPPSH